MDGDKQWWQSRAVWSSIVAALSGAAMLFGFNVGAETQVELTETILLGVGVAGSLAAIWGRIKATKTIGKKGTDND
jgi:hypothetical protein